MLPEATTNPIAEDAEPAKWYVMRDLKRANAKLPAYKLLQGKDIEVFTPMKWNIVTVGGRRHREEVPYIRDLLFVHAKSSVLDSVVAKTPTLQYRFVKGKAYREAMTVEDTDMDRFIKAVRAIGSPRYYAPKELTPAMYGKRIRIIGGELDGYEGCLLRTQGSRKKRILIELPSLLVAAVEIAPDYIEVI